MDRLGRQRRQERRPCHRQRRSRLRLVHLPELLEKAGISWKIYQDIGEGLDAAHFWGWTGDNPYIGNYGDNSLLYFHQYQNAPEGTPLAEKARTGTNIPRAARSSTSSVRDVLDNKLPQVSWVVAPEAYTEHPNWPANYGAWYVSQVLDALTANPEVWSKTVFFLMYDENDGFFDHIVPADAAAIARRKASPLSTPPTKSSPATRQSPPAPTVSACACRWSSSRRGAKAASSTPKSSTTLR